MLMASGGERKAFARFFPMKAQYFFLRKRDSFLTMHNFIIECLVFRGLYHCPFVSQVTKGEGKSTAN